MSAFNLRLGLWVMNPAVERIESDRIVFRGLCLRRLEEDAVKGHWLRKRWFDFRGRALKLGAPITPGIPLFDFLPVTSYATPEHPFRAPCPTTCTEFGWEIYPPGLREVLTIAGSYGRPVYITENGLADADDNQRPAYLVQHLAVLEQAITDGVADVRGYFHWSLVDNFEWAEGYFPKFGLYRLDASGNLIPRNSAIYYRRIAEANAIPQDLLDQFGGP